MNIKEDVRTIRGEHNGVSFTLRGDGVLEAFGAEWSRSKVRSLVELVSLLEHSGFNVREKDPKKTTNGSSFRIDMYRHLWGFDPGKWEPRNDGDDDDPEEKK